MTTTPSVALVCGGITPQTVDDVVDRLSDHDFVIIVDTMMTTALHRFAASRRGLVLCVSDVLDEAAIERVLHQCFELGELRTLVLLEPLEAQKIDQHPLRPSHDVRRIALRWIGICNFVRLSAERMADNGLVNGCRGHIEYVAPPEAAPGFAEALNGFLSTRGIKATRTVPARASSN